MSAYSTEGPANDPSWRTRLLIKRTLEISREPALLIVAADEAEHVAPALFGEARMGGIGRDHQDVRGLVEARGEQ